MDGRERLSGRALSDGAVLWSNRQAAPSYGPTTAVPTVVFMGTLVRDPVEDCQLTNPDLQIDRGRRAPYRLSP